MELVEEFANNLLCLISSKCEFYSTEEKTLYAMEQEELDKLIYSLLDEFKKKYK